MAKCKLCRTDIPDDTEYCPDCQDKKNGKLNESYLDSLLSSVKNSSEPTEVNYKKKLKKEDSNNPGANAKNATERKKALNTVKSKKTEQIKNSELDVDDLYRVDFSDIEDFDKFNLDADLQDLDSDIVIGDEDLYGGDLTQLLLGNDNEASEVQEAASQSDLIAVTEDNIIPQELEELPDDTGLDLDLDELLNSLEMSDDTETSTEIVDSEKVSEAHEEIQSFEELNSLGDIWDIEEQLNSGVIHNTSGDEERPYSDGGQVDDMDLAAAFMSDGTEGEADFEPVETEDEDFLNLLSQISPDDPVSDDLRELNNLMHSSSKSDAKAGNIPTDVGEVFSDALTAVSSLKDYDLDGEELLNSLSKNNNETGLKENKGKKDKKKKATKKSKSTKTEGNIFQRLFGNVKDEKTATRFTRERKAEADGIADTAFPEGQTKKGKMKGKKGSKASAPEEQTSKGKRLDQDSEEEQGTNKKADKKKAKAEEKRAKAEKKKANAKKIKAKEVIEVIDEINEDPGRINRLGAAIVFTFFGALAFILILGTNVVSYTLNVQYATNYFSKQKYTEAYYQVYGTELKDEDLELYDKITTVMFVNKQLNSYNNYFAIKKYPEALDSLLKGLKRYDKYIELATMLGIDTDLNYVRNQILAELENKFNLSEREAAKINNLDNMKDYSLAVYDVVLEKMNQ